MSFPRVLLTGVAIGLTTGSLTTSAYHLKQRQEERKAFLECQLAWEKYYSLTMLFKKEYLNYLAGLKSAKKPKSHYQELLKEGWKDYDLYLLESWKTSEDVNIKHRLVYYHTKYQPKLNLFRYVYLASPPP